MPVLRGKQFELLALKEMAEDLARGGVIHPVIEPVRLRGDALGRCLDALGENSVPATVVLNPPVGELAQSNNAPGSVLAILDECTAREHLRLGVWVDASTDVSQIATAIAGSKLSSLPVDFLHAEFAGPRGLNALATDASCQLLEAKEQLRRYRPALAGSLVKWTDPFPRRRTNLEYVGAEPSLFTDDNVYFRDDGYEGFSDYATIGRDFSEGGSSPRAVVIHLTYDEPADGGSIWVRHFCSTSNEDTADTAGKFGEALAELVDFLDERDITNPAAEAFRHYGRNGLYPGLGMVKKLSIQNHLFLVTRLLTSG